MLFSFRTCPLTSPLKGLGAGIPNPSPGGFGIGSVVSMFLEQPTSSSVRLIASMAKRLNFDSIMIIVFLVERIMILS
jgi:hypothetical protein